MPNEQLAAASQLNYWWMLALFVFLVLVPLAVSWSNKQEAKHKRPQPPAPPADSATSEEAKGPEDPAN
ncbi:MAG: hypothetical protein RRB13_06965 [bacterium]|nr:hypothetical protein [bacterium]MDT8446624.1 hypothetical protein [bacterium]